LLCARCAEGWGLSTMQAEIPSYFNGVLNMDIKHNAFFSALPFLAMWIFAYIFLIIADVLLDKGVLSLTALRKTFNSIAFWTATAALIAIGFLDAHQKTGAICLMTVAVGLNSGATLGSSLNTIDLSPNHAGILMGMVNTIANFIPIVTPLFVGLIVKDKHDRTQWQMVFIVAAVIFFFGNLVFIIFGTAVAQPWDASDYLQRNDTEAQKPNAQSGAGQTKDGKTAEKSKGAQQVAPKRDSKGAKPKVNPTEGSKGPEFQNQKRESQTEKPTSSSTVKKEEIQTEGSQKTKPKVSFKLDDQDRKDKRPKRDSKVNEEMKKRSKM